MLTNPGIRNSLEFFHPVGQGNRPAETGKQMHMVLDAANSDDGTPEAIANLAEMGMELMSQSEILERGLAVLCREDQMHPHRREGLRHGRIHVVGRIESHRSRLFTRADATPLGLNHDES